jgi:hypothetical protein
VSANIKIALSSIKFNSFYARQMEPLAQTRFAVHHVAKVHRLEADVERMADVIAPVVVRI